MTLRQACKAWSFIAVGALAIDGVFALLLVFSRTPVVQDFLPWPWKSFFHKGLVTHVIFSFVVWFLATMGAVFSFRLAQKERADIPSTTGPWSLGLALIGCVGLIVPALFDLGTPELNNYVPVMNHWAYYAGLVSLMAGLVLSALRQLSCDGATRACSILYLLACVCFVLAWAYLDDGLPDPTYNEQLFWGGGHVLQFVNTALLILVWISIVKTTTGEDLLSGVYRRITFGLLVLFALPAPFIYFFFDIVGQVNRDFYTDLLRYGLPLPSTIASFALFLFLLVGHHSEMDRVTKSALWLSLFTYNLGGLYGIFLDGTDTRVPAHYHAVIGGINLAFMIFYHRVVLPFVQVAIKEGKLIHVQYWLYGLGQIMHASGMFLAGLQGVPRKTAGDAQGLDNIEKLISMGLMGVGGVIAVIGGVLFVVITMKWMMQGGRVNETL